MRRKPQEISLWSAEGKYRQLMELRNVNENGYAMTMHAHSYYELVFGYSRIPVCHRVGGQVIETDTPFILWRAPYILHSVSTRTKERYERYQIGFHPGVLTEYGGVCALGKLANHWECTIPVDEAVLAELEPLFKRLARVRDSRIPRRIWICALAEILYEVGELIPQTYSETLPVPSYMQELLQYIEAHMGEALTIDALAERFFISRAKLTRDFRTAMRFSLHEYITALRIARAKLWLEEGVPLFLIAERCGYSRESAFARMFRQETGMSPAEWSKTFKGE